MGDIRRCLTSSSSLRIFSAMKGPPGSRVTTTSRPSDRSHPASFLNCVVLPQPSIPSKLMKTPGPLLIFAFSFPITSSARTSG